MRPFNRSNCGERYVNSGLSKQARKVETLCSGLIASVLFRLFFIIGLAIPAFTTQAETIITNTATASFSINGSSQTLTDSAQFTKDEVVTPPDEITLQKQSNKNIANVDDLITYTLIVNNPNPRALKNITIRDTLPAGLKYETGTALLNNTIINNSQINYAANVLTFNLSDMPANSVWNIDYQLKVTSSTPAGVAINQAIVSSDTATSLPAQANVNITVTPPAIPLLLSKQANKSSAKIGDVVLFTLDIINNNPYEIANIKVEDTLPTGLEFEPGTAELNRNGNKQAITADTSNGLQFLLGNIPSKTTWTLVYTAKISDALISTSKINALTNKARVLAEDSDANSAIATASVDITSADISILKQVNRQSANFGDTISYTVTISNPAQHDLVNLVAQDLLPPGFEYKVGSAKIDAQLIPANQIQYSGRSLQLLLGKLAKDQTAILTYDVLVTENAASGDAINQVQAESDYALSDLATATVNVRTPSTIVFLTIDAAGIEGVIPPTSFNDNQNGGKHWQEIDLITLADGSKISLPTPQPLTHAEEYTSSDPVIIEVKDLDQNTDPNQLDTIIVTIEVPGTNDKEVLLLTETGPDTGIFRGVILTTSDASDIQNGLLTLRSGSEIKVNYRDEEDSTDVSASAALVIPDTRLGLSKTSDKAVATIGELVRYTLTFQNTTRFKLPDVDIRDTLPPGFRYLSGSALLNGSKLTSQQVTARGRSLDFTLNNMPAGSQWTLEYVTKISAGVQIGKAINEARINSGPIQSNIARASVEIEDELMRTRNILTGRVYIGCEGTPSEVKKDDKKYPKVLKDARIYMETGRNVLSDEEGFWHMEGIQPGTHVLQLDEESLPSGYEPMLCIQNTRHAGDAKSQFVDLQPGSIWQVDFYVKETGNKDNKDINKKDPLNRETENPAKKFGQKYLESTAEGFDILWPRNNYVPAVASTKIFVKSPPKQKVEVFLNGKPVSALNYDGSDTNKANTVTIRRWYGVDLDINSRNNQLLVILKNKSGKEIARKTRNIHFSGEPASAEFLDDESILIADGKTTPVIAIRVKDEDGFPMRANTHGYFSIENGNFQVKTLIQESDTLNLNESLASSHQYLIEEDGIARIQLNPTTQSGEITLNLKFTDRRTQTIRAWLKPNLRKWILVGLAEGTLAHKSVSGNLSTLKDLEKDDSFIKSGRIAFFAKGKIKGKYLLTAAYDTHKQKNEVGSQLDGNIDPDAWYTVYADNSNSQHDAPSSRKLYVKIEKENFYAMFGDYRTGLTVTELASYERVLNGIKSEYKGERYSYNAFISETSNQHQRDEIPGDGTSGLYYISRHIIQNSENVKIETRDRFHSETILETRELVRYQDYDIDYDAGTLFFKSPVNGRDRNLNPNIIVVEYDSESDSNKEITAGGRVAINTRDKRLEVGLSAIREGRNKARDNSLIATDLTYKITTDTELHAEIAQSKTEQGQYETKQAYVIELEKQIANMEARLYHRQQDENFGISSQASESGTQKTGAELRYRYDHNTDLNAEISHQKNLANDNKRQLAQVDVARRYEQFELRAGARHSKESFADETITNNALLAGGSYTTKNGKITLRTDLEKNINQDKGSETSPDRAIVGVDVKLDHGFTVFAEHETTDNGEIKTHNNRVGVSKPLWEGAKGKTSYTQERTDQGQRNYATLGLDQRIQVTDKIKADFSIDHAKTISNNQTPRVFNPDEPALQGSQRDDYTAFTVGLGADEKDWSWTTRFELRDGEINDKINFRAGLIRHLKDGKNLSAKISHYHSEDENGDFENYTRLSLGSAWHPRNKNFVFLNRLDLVDEEDSYASNFVDSGDFESSSGLENHTQKIIHNMHYSHKLNDKTQLSFHHGIKHVKDTNGSDNHQATIDTATIEIRRDINKKWDFGVHGGYLHDWTEKNIEAVAGVSVGVTPMENAWLALGYNFEGFYDKDFDKSDYKRKGPYVNFRYKFNQDSFDGDLPIRRKQKDER